MTGFLTRDNIEDVFPMSDVARGMIYYTMQNPATGMYHNLNMLRLDIPNFSADTLQRAVQSLARRHPILRTAFNMTGFDEPIMMVYKDVPLDIRHQDISGLDPAARDAALAAFAKEDRRRPFAVQQLLPLWRLRTFGLGNGKIAFGWSCHHAMTDGWSSAVFLKELYETYLRLEDDPGYTPEPLSSSYKDFVLKQLLAKEDEDVLDFWKRELDGHQRIPFPGAASKETTPSNTGVISLPLSSELLERIKTAARREHSSVKNICFAAYTFMLSMLSYENDILAGLITNNRPDAPDSQWLLGCFLNTLPVRVRIPAGLSWREYLQLVEAKLLELKRYEHLSFFEIVRLSGERSNGENPLFDTVFNYIDFHVFSGADAMYRSQGGTAATKLETSIGGGNTNTLFDLTIDAGQGKFELNLLYSTSLVDEHDAHRLLGYFQGALERITDRPGSPAKKEDLLTTGEKEQILYLWNGPKRAIPADATLVSLFEEQAARTPQNRALITENSIYTYDDLNQAANRLARRLLEQGAGQGTIVAVLLEEPFEIAVSIIAVMKSGAAFVPVDPHYPTERIDYILNHSGARLAVAHPETVAAPILLISPPCMPETGGSGDNLNSPIQPKDAAYVIYTSGTSGRPKGVVVEHKSIANTIICRKGEYRIHERHVTLQLFSPSFDGFLTSFFTPLLSGAAQVWPKQGARLNLNALGEMIHEYRVTHLIAVPTLFRAMVEHIPAGNMQSLQVVTLAGDTVSQELTALISKTLPSLEIAVEYGVTEAAVMSTIRRRQTADNPVSIGAPVWNTQLFVVDNHLRLLPPGSVGELCIAGAGLARGYLANPDLTAEAFVPKSWGEGGLVYRSGDLARYLPDGSLQFLGRRDHQVKIRGFRIETTEIEHRLLDHPAVKEAVVTVITAGQTQLAAYVVCPGEETVDSEDLREFLSLRLPAYMLPDVIVPLEKMPLTPNGKKDRNQLPLPQKGETAAVLPPETDIQTTLAAMWSEVLKIDSDRVGLAQDFFQLGGHSLNAAILAARIQDAFKISIPIQDIFKHSTLREMAACIQRSGLDRSATYIPMEKRDHYPLSSGQKRLYLLSQMAAASTVYHIPLAVSLEGELDHRDIEGAFQALIARHESLRTRFVLKEGQPVQQALDVDLVDFQLGTGDGKDFLTQPMDLAAAPLMRATLVKKEAGRHELLVEIHHIVADGVSMTILIREFLALMARRPLPPLNLHYRDIALIQGKNEFQETMSRQLDWWRQRFDDGVPRAGLPLDFPRPAVQTFDGQSESFVLEPELLTAIKSLAEKEEATLFMILLTAFHVLLAKLSGADDLVIGIPVAGRRLAGLDGIIGMFVNTLALRLPIPGALTFQEAAQRVKSVALEAFDRQEARLEDLIEALGVQRDTGRNPLFDVVFSMQNIDADLGEHEVGHLKLTPLPIENLTAKFDLTLQAAEKEGQLSCLLEYNTALFKPGAIRRFIDYFRAIARAVADNPAIPVGEIDYIPAQEKQRLLVEWNNTDAAYPMADTLASLWRNQARVSPHRAALTFRGKGTVTYKWLDQKASRLAADMRREGAVPGCLVALLFAPSIDMITAALATVLCGAGYVPIDPGYPSRRIDFMLRDSRPAVLVTSGDVDVVLDHDLENFSIPQENILRLEDVDDDTTEVWDKLDVRPQDPAYVIYTSGTTGRPKGVVIEHRHVTRLLFNHRFPFDFDERDVWTLFHSYCFDFSVWEMYGPLLRGGRLVIVPRMTARDIPAFGCLLARESVTILNQTPSAFYRLSSEILSQTTAAMPLRMVIFGGEALNPPLLRQWNAAYPAVKLVNMYGITETTVHVTYKEIGPKEIEAGDSAIGGPIPTLRCLVMDGSGKLAATGVAGELWVGGTGVARGYLNRPRLTAEKFVQSGYYEGMRMYRSGDLAKWTPAGELVYLGRIDQQVKIRGHRIELAEVETHILALDDVKQALVVHLKGDGDDALCAYVASDRNIPAGELRDALSSTLPHYMIPSFFVVLETFPLTANGKVDRKALPKPRPAVAVEESDTPANELESRLAAIWAEVLGIDVAAIGVTQNFFELGGHSLKASQVTALIHEQLDVKVPLAEMFKTPTIKELAAFILHREKEELARIVPSETMEYYPLSSPQRRLYALQQLDKQSVAYHIPMAVQLEGDLDRDKLERVFQQLIQRHEALRTAFVIKEDGPVQKIYPSVDFTVETVMSQSWKRDFRRPFDLERPPLLRVGLRQLSETRHLLVLDLHHLVADGRSLQLLMEEFLRLYNGENLPEPELRYRDFVLWQQAGGNEGPLGKQMNYWLRQLDGELPVLNLPLDFPRPPLQSFKGDRVEFEIDRSVSQPLRTLASAQGATLYMVFLTIFHLFLSRISGQEEMIIGTPVEGRRHPGLRNVMGMFVNTLPLRLRCRGDQPFSRCLQDVKTTALEALAHQETPLEDVTAQLNAPRDRSRNPLFDVVFTLQEGGRTNEGIAGLTATAINDSRRFSKFDLTMQVMDRGDSLWGELEFCSDLFTLDTIERFSRLFLLWAEKIVACPNVAVAELELVSQREKETILSEFNNTAVLYTSIDTVLDLFWDRAKTNPHRLALAGCSIAGEDRNIQLSYGLLARTASLWAQALVKHSKCGNLRDRFVAVMLPPSLEMVQAQLGILMANAAFLPLDEGLPEERVQLIIEDSSASMLVTTAQNPISLPENVAVLDASSLNIFVEAGDEEFARPLPNDVAYLIYTSGSSGVPKGVVVEHRGLYNLCRWHNAAFAVTCLDRATRYAGFGFDASVWETFPYLCVGAALFMIPHRIRLDMETLNDYFQKYDITIAFLPTQICRQFAHQDNTSLRLLLTGGDELQEVRPTPYQLINNYGPSENTVVATSGPVAAGGDISIGIPIHNNRVYIVDPNLKLQPVGIPGELCIAGANLARGYLNRPELTAGSFVPDPFAPVDNGAPPLMYRSGDRARYLPGGQLQFLGRMDRQVKIRGLRIEPGEIQQRLIRHPDVADAFVRIIESADHSKHLCAYIVPRDRHLDEADVRAWLGRVMPSYMIPQWFVEVEALPLNASGKVNAAALPLPAFPEDDSRQYAAPTNEVESLLLDIWRQVLGRTTIGIHDDFFAAGGDSIKAIQVVSRLRAAGYQLETQDLFRAQTIAKSALCVKRSQRTASQKPVAGPVPLTPIQAEFFDRHLEDPHHYNQAVMLAFNNRLEEETARRILDTLIRHHDALRITFQQGQSETRQKNMAPGMPVDLTVFDWRNNDDGPALLAEEKERIQAGIDLETGPLLKSALFRLSGGDRWLIVIHHLVVDGVSWRVLLEDIDTLLRQTMQGQPLQLPPKTDSFKKWAEALHPFTATDEFLNETDYWKSLTAATVEPLPVDLQSGTNLEQNAERVSFRLSEEDTRRLLERANRAFATRIDDLLLTALALAVKGILGPDKMWVALEGHGREPVIPLDITRTVGWFTSAYPVLLDVSLSGGLDRRIRQVKESLHQVPNRGIGFGLLKYCAELAVAEAMDTSLRPSISFNYLGQFDSDVKGELFRVAQESPGRMQSPRQQRQYELDVSGMVSGGGLSLSITYGGRRFKSETMGRLAQAFEAELLAVLDVCCRRETVCHTPSDFTYKKLSVDELDLLQQRWDIEDIYPLSPMQEGMLFHSLAAGEEPVYFEQMAYGIQGDFDVDLIRECWRRLFSHYEVLRTAMLAGERERPLQVVVNNREAEFVFHDLRGDTTEDAAMAFKLKDRARSFQLEEEPLMRLAVLRLGEGTFEFVWSFHHILMDGWCSAILMKDFFQLYNAGLRGQIPRLEPQTPYSSYIQWLDRQDRQASAAFWQSYLEGYDEAAGLPGDISVSAAGDGYRVMEVSLQLDKSLSDELRQFAASGKVTLNTLVQTVWSIILGRYNNREDVVFGAVVSGRPSSIPGVETMVGLFINTVPVRIRFEGQTGIRDLMAEIQSRALAAESHHYFPLADIQAASPLKQNLLDHIVEFQNFPVAQQVAGLVQEETAEKERGDQPPVDVQTFEQTNYDLNFTIGAGDELLLRFDFNGAVYSQDYLLKILNYFPMIFRQIMELEAMTVADVSMLDPEERRAIIDVFNDNKRDFPSHTTVHQLIEEHAAAEPDRVALVDDRGDDVAHVTYGQMDRRANLLAHELSRLGIGEDVTVGILMERSALMAESILAVWKAGGAYIPIDTKYPAARVTGILEDSHSPVLLVEKRDIAAELEDLYQGRILVLEDVGRQGEPAEAKNSEAVNVHSLAYVIYTSGSTGKPKGAMVEHIGMMNHMQAKIADLDLNAATIIAQNASHTFDISVWQFFVALVAGGKTVVYPEAVVLEPELFLHRVIDQCLTVLEVVPSYLSVLLETTVARQRAYLPMDYLMVTGEEVKPNLLDQWFDAYPAIPVVNAYGPTEASDDITHHIMNEAPQSRRVPVGIPLQNLTIYIVDRYMNMCPVGMKGEICVAGVGVGRGYLFDPERTANVFMEDPFAPQPGIRLYKTGDLGSWRPDGSVDFFGRIDYQVKIRGFRIELGEIENRLANHESVKEAVVIDREGADSKKFLCAYVVPCQGEELDVEALKEFLGDQLPDYMIPSFFVILEQLPLNANGKVDRKALPEPRMDGTAAAGSLPRDDIERRLLALWAEVLDVKRRSIDIDSNFFELGGHSLKVTVLVSRIHKAVEVKVPIIEVFRRPTVRQLAEFIRGAEESRYSAIQPGETRDYYPVSSAQKRMFLVSQLKAADTSDNSPEVMLAQGNLDFNRFQETIEALAQRHETLRTSFELVDDQPVQRVHPQVTVDITRLESSLETLADTVDQFIRPFDLGRAPLFRVGMATLGDGQFAILFDIHHIVSDGVSSLIMMKEFVEIYNRTPLPPLRLQYRDFAFWQQQLFASEAMERQQEFWRETFSGQLPVLSLPLDFQRPKMQSYEGEHLMFECSPELSAQLSDLVLERGATLFIVMLALFNVLLAKYSGQEDIIVGTPTAGRPHVDLEGLIGMFVNTLALRNQPLGSLTFTEFLDRVGEQTLKAFENQDFQFEQLVDTLGLQRDSSRNMVFDVMLAVANVDAGGGQEGIREVTFKPFEFEGKTTPFDLVMYVYERDVLSFKLMYCTKLFKRETIEAMARHFMAVAEQVAREPETRIAAIQIFSQEEKGALFNSKQEQLDQLEVDFDF
jgi:amino acid adenylation domain-containing protein/non-ribosomal peptide synthase protein (TIGR01720 family)